MRHILKTTAIASSLVAASFVVGTGMARAQTADTATATFNGVAPSTCAFGAPTGTGVLGIGVLDNYSYGFESFTSGTAVNIPLLCSSTSQTTLSVDAPVQTAGIFLPPRFSQAWAETSLGSASLGRPAILFGTIIDENVVVNMSYQANPAYLRPGIYQFTVNVTATPN